MCSIFLRSLHTVLELLFKSDIEQYHVSTLLFVCMYFRDNKRNLNLIILNGVFRERYFVIYERDLISLGEKKCIKVQ